MIEDIYVATRGRTFYCNRYESHRVHRKI